MRPLCRRTTQQFGAMGEVVTMMCQVRCGASNASSGVGTTQPSSPPGGRAAFLAFAQSHNNAFTGGAPAAPRHHTGSLGDAGTHTTRHHEGLPHDSTRQQRLSAPSPATGPRHKVDRRQRASPEHRQHRRDQAQRGSVVNSAMQVARTQRQHAQQQLAARELRTVLRRMQALNQQKQQLDASLDPRYEHRRHELHVQLQGVFAVLQDVHFAVATHPQRIAILYGVEASGVRASFAVSACIHQLQRDVLGLSGRQLVGVLNVVLGLEAEGLWGVPQDVMRDALGAFVRALLAKDGADYFSSIHPNSLCKLLHLSIRHHYQWAEGRGGGQVGASVGSQSPSPLLCDGLGCELLVSILQHCLVHPAAVDDEGAASTSSRGSAVPSAALRKELELGHLVCIIEAIAFHRVPNEQALLFLSTAAPRIRDAVLDLNAHELSSILIAYARVGYRNPEWFVAVGQRAGDVGERMSEDEAANVLLAFSLVGIEHTTLRNSLESSMRMKHLRRSTLMNRMF